MFILFISQLIHAEEAEKPIAVEESTGYTGETIQGTRTLRV
jgi:hypothetical protein